MYTQFINYLNKSIETNKDFTVRIDSFGNLYKPITGFAVSITPVINIGMSTFDKIKYIIENNNIDINGSKYPLYLGGWIENNPEKLSTDISVVITDKVDAIQVGMYCKQIAIYDIDKSKNIFL